MVGGDVGGEHLGRGWKITARCHLLNRGPVLAREVSRCQLLRLSLKDRLTDVLGHVELLDFESLGRVCDGLVRCIARSIPRVVHQHSLVLGEVLHFDHGAVVVSQAYHGLGSRNFVVTTLSSDWTQAEVHV